MQVELIICQGHGDSCGTWATDYIDIPLDTPDDQVEEVARDKWIAEFEHRHREGGGPHVAHVALYHQNYLQNLFRYNPEDEIEDDEDDAGKPAGPNGTITPG